MLYILLSIAALLTSLVSGVLSMAGGMILMGIFGLFLSVPAAMVLHGITQTASNGSRIWLHRQHIRWAVLYPYSIGAFVCLGLFVYVQYIPSKGLIFILIGTFPFIALRLPESINLDMDRKHVSLSCGFLVTLSQLLAGASGPLLDIFYVTSRMSRYEILGTKAITQTLGHILKLSYYAFFLSELVVDLPWAIYPVVVAAALLGNAIGMIVIKRMSDTQFRIIGRYVVLVIGALYIGKGVYEIVCPVH